MTRLHTMTMRSGAEQPERDKRKARDGKSEARTYGKDMTEEVDTLVRNGQKSSGPHCDALLAKADLIAKQDKMASAFKPSISSTPLEIFVTVNLKAKTLKRLLAKLAILAGGLACPYILTCTHTCISIYVYAVYKCVCMYVCM
jgi:hypothetical protein